MSDPEQRDFAGFRIVRPLELSERASVWAAEDPGSGAIVAIETLAGDAARDEHVAEWFTEAWELAAGLADPAIVTVLSVGEQDGVPFAVRSPAGEMTLAERLDRGGPLSAGAALQVLAEIGGALEAAHDGGVVHGALGPASVVLDEHGRAHLAGFGRREGSRREDVAALGALLVAMLGEPGEAGAGEPTTGDAPDAVAGAKPSDPVATGWEAAQAEVLRAVGRAGAAGEYARAADLVATARAARPQAAPGGPGRGRLWAVVAGIAALVVIAVLLVLLIGGDDEGEGGSEPTVASTSATDAPTPATGPSRPITVRGFPVGVAASDGVIYAVTRDGGSLDGFDEATGERILGPVGFDGEGGDVTVFNGAAWVTEGPAGAVARVDLGTDQPAATTIETGGEPGALTGARGAIWVIDPGGRRLLRLPSDAGADTEPEAFDLDAADPTAIAFGLGSLWITDGAGKLLRIDPDDPSQQRAFDVGGSPAGVAIAGGTVWITDAARGSVLAFDPESGSSGLELPVGGEPDDLAADGEHLWVANADGYVTMVDLDSGAIQQIDLSGAGGSPRSIAVGDQVWVATGAGDTLVAIAAASP